MLYLGCPRSVCFEGSERTEATLARRMRTEGTKQRMNEYFLRGLAHRVRMRSLRLNMTSDVDHNTRQSVSFDLLSPQPPPALAPLGQTRK